MPRTDLIQLRRGTASEWTSANPNLAAGEIGFETDTDKIKVGDGSTSWNSLAYVAMTPAEVASAISAYAQPLDGDLTAIAALTSAANKVPYATGSGTWALTDLTSAGRALIDDADAAAQRTTLGLGSVDNTSDSGKPVSTAQQAAIDANVPSTAFVTMLLDTYITNSTGNTGVYQSFSFGSNLAQFYGTGVSNKIVVGDYWEFEVFLRSGTYDFMTFGISHTVFGKAQFALDGTNFYLDDGYGAFTQFIRRGTSGITVATAGRHVLRMTAATKNASSSDQWLYYNAFTFRRTGA